MILKFLRRHSTHFLDSAPSSHPLLPPDALRKKLALQWVLVIPFLVQISAAVGLTGYISLRNGQDAIASLAEDLIGQTKDLVNQHLDSYLSSPHQINQINVNLIQQGVFAARDFDALSQHFWQQAQSYPDVSYIGFGLPNGEYVGAGDWYEIPGIEIDRTFANSTHYTYSSNERGQPTAIIDRWNYYPTEEEWFTETVATGKARWVISFEDVAEGIYVAATANQPIYDTKGNLVGVLGVDLRISDISNFLRQLKPSPSSSIFILEQDGTLLAASEPGAGRVATQSKTENDPSSESNLATPEALEDNAALSQGTAEKETQAGETNPETEEKSGLPGIAASEQPAATETIQLNSPEPGAPTLENGTPPTPVPVLDDAAASSSSPEPSPADIRADQRYNIRDSNNPEIQAIATALYDSDGNQKDNTGQILSVDIEGDRQYLQVTPWQDEMGLDWRIVVMVPESDFTAQIEENTRNTLLLCVLALSVASLLGMVTARWIAQPILQINKAAGAIATGQLDQQVPSSNIRELATLSASFNHMAEQVKRSLSQYAQDNETLEERVKERTQELRQAIEELQQTQAQLVHNEKMSSLGQLVAGIAHELNNPINFIYGNLPYASVYVEQLLALLNQYQTEYPHPSATIQNLTEEVEFYFLQEDLPRLLNSLNVGASRIQEIIRSLRCFSRVDESTLKTADLHEGIESTLMILNSRIKAQPNRGEIKIIRAYGDIPKIDCSPGQLNQVMMNILSNAIDALESAIEKKPSLTPKISIRTYLDQAQRTSGLLVRSSSDQAPDQNQQSDGLSAEQHANTHDLSAEQSCDRHQSSQQLVATSAGEAPPRQARAPEQANCVTIAIADNGSGISDAVRRRIFDPFFTTKPIGKGTGLGLSISYKIITEKHHGILTCNSTPGRGTEFQITLPIHSESEGEFGEG